MKLSQQLIDEDLNSADTWRKGWVAANPDGPDLDPTKRPSRFVLSRKNWTTLKRIQRTIAELSVGSPSGDLLVEDILA